MADMPGPGPGIASKAFVPFPGETREWQAKEDARDALLRQLPKLTTRQLVAPWDVFWISPNGGASSRDTDATASGFARRFNDTALTALADEKEPDRRRLLINMLKPQANTFTEKQAEAFLKAGGRKEWGYPAGGLWHTGE